jgi:hypothetical protein
MVGSEALAPYRATTGKFRYGAVDSRLMQRLVEDSAMMYGI